MTFSFNPRLFHSRPKLVGKVRMCGYIEAVVDSRTSAAGAYSVRSEDFALARRRNSARSMASHQFL
jgi:hypothetical protein